MVRCDRLGCVFVGLALAAVLAFDGTGMKQDDWEDSVDGGK